MPYANAEEKNRAVTEARTQSDQAVQAAKAAAANADAADVAAAAAPNDAALKQVAIDARKAAKSADDKADEARNNLAAAEAVEIAAGPAVGGADANAIDLTQKEYVPAGDTKKIAFKQESYDTRVVEDGARRNIAYWLLGILTLLCYAGFMLVIALPERLNETMRLLELIFSPVVALVSAATGFYYGTKNNTK